MNLWSQQPVTIQLKEADGLPDIEFYDILEDPNGFIWFAADKGLFRHNGRDFIKFDNQNKKGLSVFDLNIDHKGRIWCINLSGQLFYAEDDQLVQFVDIGSELNFQIADIIIHNGILYAFSIHEVFSIDLESRVVNKIFESKFRVGAPYKFENELWFVAGAKLFKLEDKQIVELLNDPNLLKDEKEEVRPPFMIKGDQNFVCIKYTNSEDYKFYDFTTNSSKVALLSTPKQILGARIVNVFYLDNTYWFCTDKGVFLYKLEDGKFLIQAQYFKDIFVTKIIKDKDQNYWFTTLGDGVYVMPNIYVRKLALTDHTEGITAIHKQSDSILIYGTKNGSVIRYEISKNKAQQIKKPNGKKVNVISGPLEKESFLISFDYVTYKYSNQKFIDLSLPHFTGVKSITVRPDKSILLGSYSSAKVLESKGNSYEFSHYLNKKRTKVTFYDTIANGSYVGYINKLVYYSNTSGSREILWKNKPILATTIDQTQNGIVWVGTTKDGIFGIDRDTVKYHLDQTDKLLSNTVFNIKGNNNFLWITTSKGIQKLDIESGKVQSLTQSDGILSYNIVGIDIFENDIVFGSNKGLYAIDKNKAFKVAQIPKIYFTNVSVANKDTLVLDKYRLPYGNNKIDFEFFSNGFRANEYIIYEYALIQKGEVSWNQLPKGVSSIGFNSLSSGDYIFKVRAFNIKTGKRSESKEISIKVLYPLWKHPIFVFSIFSVIAILIYLFVKWRMNVQKKSQELRLMQMNQEKEMIAINLENLRSQMNPHFIFNALTAIQEYILLNEKELASEYLVKFSRLIRIYLEHSQEEMVSLEKEIEALQLYLELEKERFEDDFSVFFKVDKGLEGKTYPIPSLFIQPYVENAIKHGLLHKKDKRELYIFFEKIGDNVVCTIQDNGVGRDNAALIKRNRNNNHKSFATSANQHRLNLINQNRSLPIKVSVEDLYKNTNPRGTRVTIIIPVIKNNQLNTS